MSGIGAYATAYLTTALGWSPWLGLLAGIVLTVVVALMLGYVTLHLGGHYLPLTTIAWGIAIYCSFGNFEFLGSLWRHRRHSARSRCSATASTSRGKLYYLIWIFCGLALLGASNLLTSRQGRAIRALRGGKGMSESLGIDVFWVRLCVFVLAAALAGIAGWLYAHMTRFVSPAPFGLSAGIEYLLMAVLGGAGTIAARWSARRRSRSPKNWLQDLLPLSVDQQRQSRDRGVRLPVHPAAAQVAQRHRAADPPISAATPVRSRRRRTPTTALPKCREARTRRRRCSRSTG